MIKQRMRIANAYDIYFTINHQGENKMINIFEVNETNKMIEQENLDVRTITMGISFWTVSILTWMH